MINKAHKHTTYTQTKYKIDIWLMQLLTNPHKATKASMYDLVLKQRLNLMPFSSVQVVLLINFIFIVFMERFIVHLLFSHKYRCTYISSQLNLRIA